MQLFLSDWREYRRKDFFSEETTLYFEINEIKNYELENLYRNKFVDTVKGYKWYDIKSLSLGDSAIGYGFAYVLVRILATFNPESILETGLGQSTKIINSYVRNNGKKVCHDIVEQNSDWTSFFSIENPIDTMNIYHRELQTLDYHGENLYRYKDFGSVVEGKHYSLISIDGPWGGKYISRIDILDYIPQILDDDFVIMLDDYNRYGEKQMIAALEDKLKENNIEYKIRIYHSIKDVCVCVSERLSFLTTL